MKTVIKLIQFITAIIILIISVLLFITLPDIHTSQNNNKVTDINIIYTNELPKAEFADILIKIGSDSEEYTENNSSDLDQLPFDTEKVIRINREGYVSLSAHYSGIFTDMTIKHETETTKAHTHFTAYDHLHDDFSQKYRQNISGKYSDMIIVIMDKNGEIISETSQFSISENSTGWMNGSIHFDMRNNSVKVSRFNKTLDAKNRDMVKKRNTILFILILSSIAVFIFYVVYGMTMLFLKIHIKERE